MLVSVLAPGLLTTVQDAGRQGARAFGVGVSGAADAYSLAVGNVLAGNPPDAAALEITLTGPTLRFGRSATIALCGAAIDAHVDGIALPGWRPIRLRKGATLVLGACRRGARAYLSVAGGIDVPLVLGSRSTDLRGGFGGHRGRALRRGDEVSVGSPPGNARHHREAVAIAPWWIDHEPDLDFSDSIAVRVLTGHDASQPSDALHAHEWIVDASSNRQGLRLRGPALQAADARERISEPVTPGTIQLPSDGAPIVLLADAQTVGGYPRIGHVITADLPRLAQRRAGQRLRFIPVDHALAARANAQQRARLGRIAVGVRGLRTED